MVLRFPIPSPIIEFLVLGMLADAPSYGYEINQRLKQLTPIKESTLYPILKKMEINAYLETFTEVHQGRQRKYYRRTERGIERFQYLNAEWDRYSQSIETLARGED